MAEFAYDERPSEEYAGKGRKKLAAEAKDRLAGARYQKIQVELDLREGYWFAAPLRARNVLSTTKTVKVPPKDAQELNTSFAFELCGDFPTVIINTFLPQVEMWFERRPSMIVPDELKPQVKKDAEDGDKKIFESILGCNFYEECAKSFEPDLALGTIGMWIDPKKGFQPIKCQAIPIRELEINVGPDGSIDDRFVVRYTEYRYLQAILPGVELPPKIQKKVDGRAKGDCIVIWGFWRLYEDDGEETWQSVLLVDGEPVGPCPKLKGTGCCPLVVARFNASPEWAWGMGPLRKALPDLRVMDELSMKQIKAIDLALMPPVGYPDDSIVHTEQGIEAGMAYPIRPGSEGAIKNIYDPPPQDAAIYFTQDREQRLRRLFYLDWPQQRGDTPPTATQWLDEMTKAQQRIGTPGYLFWSEFCGGVVSRFQYILEKQGIIKPPALNGKAVSLVPYNPAQKAAEAQEVAQFGQFVQFGTATAPEEFKVWTDGQKTLLNLAKKSGGDKIWVMRSKQEVAAAIDQIKQLAGAQQGPAPPQVPGAPSGPPADLAGPAPNQPTFEVRSRSSI